MRKYMRGWLIAGRVGDFRVAEERLKKIHRGCHTW